MTAINEDLNTFMNKMETLVDKILPAGAHSSQDKVHH